MPDKLLGTPQVTIPEGEKAYDVAGKALGEMIRRGIFLPERPDFHPGKFVRSDGSPRMPTNIQDLSGEEIGELYNIVEQYYSYVTGQLAEVTNSYEVSKEIFKLVAAKVRLGKDGKQQDKTDRQIADRRYVLARADALELQCLHNLLSKVLDKLDSDMKVISRGITLREQQLKTGIRIAGVQARNRFRALDATSYDNNFEPRELIEVPAPKRVLMLREHDVPVTRVRQASTASNARKAFRRRKAL